MDSQTSVYRKSAPCTAASMSSVSVSVAPDPAARPSAMSRTSADGCNCAGAQMRTSRPNIAPVTSSEFAVLFRASPR